MNESGLQEEIRRKKEREKIEGGGQAGRPTTTNNPSMHACMGHKKK